MIRLQQIEDAKTAKEWADLLGGKKSLLPCSLVSVFAATTLFALVYTGIGGPFCAAGGLFFAIAAMLGFGVYIWNLVAKA